MTLGLPLVVLLAVLEQAGVGLPLVLPMVAAMMVSEASEREGLAEYLMVIGVVLDLLFINRLGMSSLVLLVSNLVVVEVKKRLGERADMVGLGIGWVVVGILERVYDKRVGWEWVMGSLISILIWYGVWRRPRIGNGVLLGEKMKEWRKR